MEKTFYLMLVTVMIITACQSKTKTASNDADAIRNIEDQWAVANKAKDINKVVSIFTSDAVVIEPIKTRRIDHIWSAKIHLTYNTKQQAFNSCIRWLI